jgi:TolA-binding protein
MSRCRIILAALVIPVFFAAQDIDEAIRLFNASQFDKAHKVFKELLKNEDDPRIAEVYYYMARLSISQDSTLYYYNMIIREHPQSRFADISYLEIAKLNVAHSDYRNAIIFLNELLKNYPDTNLKDEVFFWLGISQIESGNKEQGIKVLENLIATFPKSTWAIRATAIIPGRTSTQEYYTVQVGSFRKEDNARKNIEDLKTKGLEARIVETVINNSTFYRVWIGQFSTIDDAKKFALRLDSLGIKGNVVKGY